MSCQCRVCFPFNRLKSPIDASSICFWQDWGVKTGFWTDGVDAALIMCSFPDNLITTFSCALTHRSKTAFSNGAHFLTGWCFMRCVGGGSPPPPPPLFLFFNASTMGNYLHSSRKGIERMEWDLEQNFHVNKAAFTEDWCTARRFLSWRYII